MANNFISPFVSSSVSDQCLDLVEGIGTVVNESSLFNDSLDEKTTDNVISSNCEILNDSLCMEDEIAIDTDEKTAGSVLNDLDIENKSVDTETQYEPLVLKVKNSTHSMSLTPSTDVPKIMPSFGKKSSIKKSTALQSKKRKQDVLCDSVQPHTPVTMEEDRESEMMKGNSGESHQINEKTNLVFTAPKKSSNTVEGSLTENEKTTSSISDKLQNHSERIQLKEEKKKIKEQKGAERERLKEEKRLLIEKKKAEREQKKMEKQLKKMEREKQKSLKTKKASGKRKPKDCKELTNVVQKVPDEWRSEYKEDGDQEVPKEVGSDHKVIDVEEKEMEEKVMEEKVMEEKEMEEKVMEKEEVKEAKENVGDKVIEKRMEEKVEDKEMEENMMEMEENIIEMEEKVEDKEMEENIIEIEEKEMEENIIEMEEKVEDKEMEIEKKVEEKEMEENIMEEKIQDKDMEIEKKIEEKEIEKDQGVIEKLFEGKQDEENGTNYLQENKEIETDCEVRKVIKKFSAPVKKSSMKQNNVSEVKKMVSVARRSATKKQSKPVMKKPIPPTSTWVQCDHPDCHKWRILKGVVDPSEVPDKWYCNLNTDPDHNTCSANEEVWSDLDESMEYVYTSYTVGSLVWAKMDGYPWWPAMIDQDPDLECYHETSSKSSNPVRYHVVFFDTPVSRGWIHTLNTYPYTANSIPSELSQVASKYQRSLLVAIEQANEASELSIVDRIDKWGFLLRYKREKRKRRNREGMCYKKLKPSSGLRRSSRYTDNDMENDVAKQEMFADKNDRTEMKEQI